MNACDTQRRFYAVNNSYSAFFFDLRDRVGSLVEMLQIFASQNVNVRQIENRPMPGDASGRQARFFLEVSGHHSESGLTAVLQALESQNTRVKIIGSYPAPTWVEER